jgi:FtsP/CotA-like multicopper oxidase with cupredoxin domain
VGGSYDSSQPTFTYCLCSPRWKDTVLIWPGEIVRIAIELSHEFDEEQIYLFHCHIIEHEDVVMMVKCNVVDPPG